MSYEKFNYACLRNRFEEFAQDLKQNPENIKWDHSSLTSADGLVRASIDLPENFLFSQEVGSFYTLEYAGSDITPTYDIGKGWKFHISLNDEIEGNLEKGWDIIKDILIANKVARAKIIRPHVRMAETPGEAGKQITIYSWKNGEKTPQDWIAIINQISQALVAAGIRPGYECRGCEQLPEAFWPGNNFITYRYQHKGEARARLANGTVTQVFPAIPEGVANPYADLTFNLQGQLPNQTEDPPVQPHFQP